MDVGRDCPAKANWLFTVAIIIGVLCTPLAKAARHGSTKKKISSTSYRCGLPRVQDEIWLVSSRGLGCPEPGNLTSPGLCVKRRSCTGRWVSTTPENFFSGDPNVTTSFYVHGHRVNREMAIERGMRIYRTITQCAADNRALRHVIWSWPSSTMRNRIQSVKTCLDDVRTKADRAHVDAYYLGWWLSQMHPDSDVNMIGYSYGPRVIMSALDLLGGGSVRGRVLPNRPYEKTVRVDVFAFAAAFPCGALSPGGSNENAVFVTDHLINLFNPGDPILKLYPLVVESGRIQAIGRTGVPNNVCLNHQDINSRPAVGKCHSFRRYTNSRYLMDLMRKIVFDDHRSDRPPTTTQESVEVAALTAKNQISD